MGVNRSPYLCTYMKRLLACLLLSLYLFFSGTRVLAYHYCGDVLAETRINAIAHCCCEAEDVSEEVPSSDDCCHDIIKPVKQPDTHLQALKTLFTPPFDFNLPTSYVSFYPSRLVLASRSKTAIKHPPPNYPKQLPAYLKYHALLLYA